MAFSQLDFWLIFQQGRVQDLSLFFSAIFLGIPFMVFLCQLYRPFIHALFILMVFSICQPNILGISFFGEPQYRAAVRGFDVFLVDICAIALALVMLLNQKNYRFRWLLPLTIPYFCYFVLSVLSWSVVPAELPIPDVRVFPNFTSTPPDIETFHTQIYPLYELFRIAKGFFLFWVVANYIRDDYSIKVFSSAIALSALCLVLTSVYERYGLGIYRISGDLMHANDFAVYLGMLGATLLPLAFQERNYHLSFFYILLSVALLGSIVMTVSRSALFVYTAAIALTALFGWRRFRTSRNTLFVLLGCVALVGIFSVSFDTLVHRFYYMSSIKDSLDERELFNQQAVLMAQDRLLGAGLGNFSAWSWDRYADRVGEAVEPGVPAHNIWYLTLGESGWLGALVLFFAIWGRTVQIVCSLWSSRQRPLMWAVIFGLSLAVVCVFLQSLVHHSYRNSAIYNLLQVYVGVLVGIYLMKKEAKNKDLYLLEGD